ncbi:UDP-galactopyranose mutase [Emticicia sp. BO119]|uniref:UDP-galactopyranose mutase n=1 Tax=Emticicia sp. BO119 TaxID=2757768 RepID=UPI0015F02049|nr:UDP-galactopyranose mutase [Emticicia sp. BO119]MBA4850523.1 UDP-galactopyranose mutase [Emticicia sp. BO119]
MEYDYLIVGAGLFGAVFAHEATKRGKICLVIDKRDHIGGNCYTETIEGINVHKYGPHIFHTNNKEVWDYVNALVEFNRYTYSPVANYKGKLFNLPFNMNTFYQLWGVKTPEEAKAKIDEQRKEFSYINEPKNLEEQALVLGGRDIYEKLIKGYTEKQWGRPAAEIPAFIIKRLPFRFTFDNNYFNDRYQGIPIGGYTKLFDKLLERCEVRLNTNYFNSQSELDALAAKVVYTGPIDLFYNYQFGALDYRSLWFEHELLNIDNYQGNAGVNYTEAQVPYTRIVEHKHFEYGVQPKTFISREYSKEWQRGDEPYYPINDDRNNKRYNKYKELVEKESKYIFGGRLAEYKYYDMHHIIENVLKLFKK